MERKSTVRTRSNSLIPGASTVTVNTNGNTNSGGTRTRHKSGNASYADLITRAILSSEEKRLTLSEIYDWMVDNVPGLKDQRYLHSAKGWKNAVRHTLSINPRFRKMARLGRPGWWTVDPEFLQRSNFQTGMNAQSSTASFTTAALIWDAQTNTAQRQHGTGGFRGRLSSAPALFLSPIFATATSTPFPSPTLVATSTNSRPPSSMSMLSSGASSTPISSPKLEMSPPQVTLPQTGPVPDTNTQTVQIWQEGGVGLLTVPRPLPMRVSNVHETSTQTEENIFDAPSIFPPEHHEDGSFRRLRNVCDYFENVSPVSSPLAISNLVHTGSSGTQQMSSMQSDQNTANILDQYKKKNLNVRISLAQFDNGSPILILTNTMQQQGENLEFTIPTLAPSQAPGERNGRIGKMENYEELPEDLEGIDVDPLVRCDVAAVIKFEQNMGKMPKLEIVPE